MAHEGTAIQAGNAVALHGLDGVVFNVFFLFADAQDIAAFAAVSEYSDAFAACFPGSQIYVLDVFGRSIMAQIDSGGNGIVHVFLHGGLELDTVQIGDIMALDDPGEAFLDFFIAGVIAQLMIVEQFSDGMGIYLEGLVLTFHLMSGALVADLVDGFAAAGEDAHEQGNRSGGGDG